jgi:hypothetical protein
VPGDDARGRFIVTRIVTTHRHHQKPWYFLDETMVFGGRVTMGDDDSPFTRVRARAPCAPYGPVCAQNTVFPRVRNQDLSSPIVTIERNPFVFKGLGR